MNENEEKICKACGRKFRPSNYTVHIQKYCTYSQCRKARKLARQKRWREKMRAQDGDWRQKASKFASESRKRKEQREASTAKESVKSNFEKNTEQSKTIVAGMAAVMGGAKTYDELAAFLAKMEIKGRKLLSSCLPIR